ncbi:MAG: hypothetical protein JSS81_02515 [Acidobacteria bacterium]|nr:hypothetical protein [Acidobacteriota bacterium]
MKKESKVLGKEMFDMIMAKVTLLRIEMELLESEGEGLRQTADRLVAKLKETELFNDVEKISEPGSVIHQKWAEQAQRHYTQANSIGKIMLEKSRQILDLVRILKEKLRELGFVVPETEDFIVWDDVIYEKDEPFFEADKA